MQDQPLAKRLVTCGLEINPELAQRSIGLSRGRSLLLLGRSEVDLAQERVGSSLEIGGLHLGNGLVDIQLVIDPVISDDVVAGLKCVPGLKGVLRLEDVVDVLRPAGAPAHTLPSTARR